MDADRRRIGPAVGYAVDVADPGRHGIDLGALRRSLRVQPQPVRSLPQRPH
jgi:hypothetical protein